MFGAGAAFVVVGCTAGGVPRARAPDAPKFLGVRAWIYRRGEVLGAVAMLAVVLAVAVPAIASVVLAISNVSKALLPLPILWLPAALGVSVVLSAICLITGLPVWVLRGPGSARGAAAVITLAVFGFFVVAVVAGAYLLAASQGHPVTT